MTGSGCLIKDSSEPEDLFSYSLSSAESNSSSCGDGTSSYSSADSTTESEDMGEENLPIAKKILPLDWS